MSIKYLPYIILQWTWGIIQTLAGLVMFLISMREKPGQSYFSFYAEKWANHLGEKFTGCKSMEMIDI